VLRQDLNLTYNLAEQL